MDMEPLSKIQRVRASLCEFISEKRKFLFGSTVAWSLVGLILFTTEFGRMVEYRFARQLEFTVRDSLGRSPKLDSRIKIFGQDDSSIAAFSNPEISLADWTLIVAAVAARAPRVVLIDKVFGVIPASEKADSHRFAAELK